MENSARKEESLLDATKGLRYSLEGRSIRATLRLYLYGLGMLAPVALLVGFLSGTQTLFRTTPLLIAILVCTQYWVGYIDKSQFVETFKKAIHHPAVKYALGTAALITVTGIYIAEIVYGEAALKLTITLFISLGSICLLWTFWAVRHSVPTPRELALRSILAISIIGITIIMSTKIISQSEDSIAYVPPVSIPAPGPATSDTVTTQSTTTKDPYRRLEIISVDLIPETKPERLQFYVRGVGASQNSPEAAMSGPPVWIVIHPLGREEYLVLPVFEITPDGHWFTDTYVYTRRMGDFEIRAIANPTGHLKPGIVLDRWPEAQNESQTHVVHVNPKAKQSHPSR